MQHTDSKTKHYGWVIVAAGTMTVFSSLGVARFSLGMLLPSMGSDIPLSYDQMGLVGTLNFIGYLIAVSSSGYLVRILGSRLTISIGLMVTGASLVAVGSVEQFYPILALYFLTGLGSGTANVPIMALVSHWFYRNKRGRAAGIMVMGNGLGIMLSGVLVPVIIEQYGASGWRICWQMLGVLVILITAICSVIIRNSPADRGLSPIGDPDADSILGGDLAITHNRERRILLQLGSIYFLYGASYVIYATFVVTTLENDYGLSEATAGNIWFWIGTISLASGPLFGSISDHWGRMNGLILVFGLQATSYLLLALTSTIELAYLSVFLFGVCAWSTPSIMAAAAGDSMGPVRATYAFGIITFIFGLGQTAGPAIAGVMAEHSGNFASSYLLAATLSGVAILMAKKLRPSSV